MKSCYRIGQVFRSAGLALLIALPATVHAQFSWSAYDETAVSAVTNNADGTTSVTVRAGARVTLIATNFVPIDFTAAPTSEVNATINFKVSGGLSTIGSGTRAIGFGLYNTAGTATNYADDNGYFTWLNGRATGSLIELRRRNGDGTSTSLLNPTGTAFNSLGTGTTTQTSGALSDGNNYSIQLHLMGRNPGVSLGNTSSTTSGAGVWVSGDGLSQTAYTNPDNPPATSVFNEVGFMFYNSTASDVTLTINSLTGLTAINPPSVTTPPASLSLNPGQSGTLSVVAAGTAPLTYQWKKDGTAVTGATGASYTIASAQTSDAGSYTTTITNAYGNVTSSAATVTVTSSPIAAAIFRQPASLTVTAGQDATFSVGAYGSSPVAYLWKKDGNTITSATNATLTVAATTATDAGSYTVTVSNGTGTVTSSAAVLTVNTKPAITTQPASVSTTVGQNVMFSVVASGSPTPTIQWQRNGVNIAGATGASYTITNVGLANTGVYTARVANSVGAVVSSGALLSIPSTLAATTYWPANGATGINVDTPLRITFDRAPVVGSFGAIKIVRASDNVVVDTLDLGVTPYTRTIGTQSVQFIFYPIIVTDNTATLFPHAGVLAYGQSYYVTIDPGVILDSTGATFGGIKDPSVFKFTTKASGPAANATALTVAADGSGDFTTVQGAIDFVPANNSQRVVITVKKGTYTEMNYVGKPFITVRGEDRSATVLQYANNGNFNTLTGNNRAMFSVDAPDFVLETITLHNLTPKGGSQAEAFRANALRVTLNRVNLLSFQDTLLVNGNACSAFVTDSYIEGDVDYMWGSGAVYFQRCELKALNTGFYAQVRNGLSGAGHVYVDCRLTSAAGVTGMYLARIDPTPGNFPYSQVIFLNCAMGSHIDPAGWQLNNATTSSTVQFWEYRSTDLSGATLDVSKRISSSRQLSDLEAVVWRNPAYVLGGWTPQLAATIETAPTSQSFVAGSNARLSVVANGSPAPNLQWYKNGVAIVGATDSTLLLPNVQTSTAASYTVSAANYVGSVTSAPAVVTVTTAKYAGVYTGTMGTTGSFSLYVRNDNTAVVLASGTPTGAWAARSGTVDANGRVRATWGGYTFDATIADSGAVAGTVGNTSGSATIAGVRSAGASPAAGYYQLGTAGTSATAYAIIDGSGKAMVVTQAGNTYDSGSGTLSSSNQLTVTTTTANVLTLTFSGTTASGTMTIGSGPAAPISSAGDANAVAQRLRQVSTRAKVGSGDSVAIVGFTLTGSAPDNVLLRAIGPALKNFGVTSLLANPRLDVYRGSSLVASNVGWSSPYGADIALSAAQAGAFPLQTTQADSALHLSLPSGSYTAVMSSATGDTTGVGLLEVYDLSGGSAGQRLTNVASRAMAGAGENTLISGVYIEGTQPKRVLIRAVGPGLAAFGITVPLAKPVLSLYRGSTLVATNTGWSTSADAAVITAATTDLGIFTLGATSADSALLLNLSPGGYTAQVTSTDGSTGIVMIEVYELP